MRRRLAMAILGFTIPFLMNCALIGSTALMMIHNESPLFIVASITMSLCVTLVVIKASFHLITELAGPLETGPARRQTTRDANRDSEEMIPMTSRHSSITSTIPSRPMSPIPPSTPPPRSPAPCTHLAQS